MPHTTHASPTTSDCCVQLVQTVQKAQGVHEGAALPAHTTHTSSHNRPHLEVICGQLAQQVQQAQGVCEGALLSALELVEQQVQVGLGQSSGQALNHLVYVDLRPKDEWQRQRHGQGFCAFQTEGPGWCWTAQQPRCASPAYSNL